VFGKTGFSKTARMTSVGISRAANASAPAAAGAPAAAAGAAAADANPKGAEAAILYLL
jgi:hypothetical protein